MSVSNVFSIVDTLICVTDGAVSWDIFLTKHKNIVTLHPTELFHKNYCSVDSLYSAKNIVSENIYRSLDAI